jgi:hypothetical protein
MSVAGRQPNIDPKLLLTRLNPAPGGACPLLAPVKLDREDAIATATRNDIAEPEEAKQPKMNDALAEPNPCEAAVLGSVNGLLMAKRHRWDGEKVVTSPYSRERDFAINTVKLNGFDVMAALLQHLTKLPHTFIVRGEPLPETNRDHCRRLYYPDPETGEAATFAEAARHWFAVDMDKVPHPAHINVAANPDPAIEYLISLLPPELHKASCWWQFTSSQGLPGHEDTLSARLWYWNREPLDDIALKRWALAANKSAGRKIIDPKLYCAVQPHYIASPVFDSMPDPVPWRHSVHRSVDDTVSLVIPEPDPADPRIYNGGTTGLGVDAYIRQIGGEDGFRGPMVAAIGSYFAINGPNADPEPIKARLRQAILAAPDGGRGDATIKRYASQSHLDAIIAWVKEQERAKRTAADLGPGLNGAAIDSTNNGAGAEPRISGQPKYRFKILRFSEIQRDKHPRYLVKRLIPRRGLVCVWGPPKAGKSFWVLDLVMHVALGWPYGGREVEGGPVLYVACEGQFGFPDRVEAFKRAKLADRSEEPEFYLLSTRLRLVTDLIQLIAEIKVQFDTIKPIAIVIDTLNRTIEGSESKDEDMGAYLTAIERLEDEFDCLIILVHHCGMDRTHPRGHTALPGTVDGQIALKTIGRGKAVAEVELMKDGPEGEQVFFQRREVEVGLDDEGNMVSSCVVDLIDAAAQGGKHKTGAQGDQAEPPPQPSSKKSRIALRLLTAAIGEKGEVAPVNGHMPPGTKCVDVEVWRDYCYSSEDFSSAKSQRQAFNSAKTDLIRRGYVVEWDTLVCPAP